MQLNVETLSVNQSNQSPFNKQLLKYTVSIDQCVLSILQHKMGAVYPTVTGVRMLSGQLPRNGKLSDSQKIYQTTPQLYKDHLIVLVILISLERGKQYLLLNFYTSIANILSIIRKATRSDSVHKASKLKKVKENLCRVQDEMED